MAKFRVPVLQSVAGEAGLQALNIQGAVEDIAMLASTSELYMHRICERRAGRRFGLPRHKC